VVRLLADGSLDPTLQVRASGLVGEVKVQADGKIVLAGSFVSLMVLSVIE
jgi:hypothetical protein